MVNMHNRRVAFEQVPTNGLIGGVMPAAPLNNITMLLDYAPAEERFVATPNQDVVYGFGVLALDQEPVVVQVPDFEGRFWSTSSAISAPTGSATLVRCMDRHPAATSWSAPDGTVTRLRAFTECFARRPTSAA